LTGFEEPESALILDPNSPNKYTLFVQPKDPKIEIWTGILTGVDDAVKVYGADKSLVIKQFDSVLNDYISRGVKIHYMKTDDKLQGMISEKTTSSDVTQLIHEMRMFKSPYEMKRLQEAIDITGRSLVQVMRNSKPGMYEYQMQAILEANFKMEGAQRIGFPSIVGSGPNTCILHYETNRRKTENGDLVVMDVGAEYDFYTADVTRTFPVNGKFTPAQKRIYNLVLAAQNEAIKFIKPGVMFYQVDSVARSIVKKGLVVLDLLSESDNPRKFFMHSTSHWLGLDVHDVGGYDGADGTKRARVLEAGMVLTVEPGIYIAEGTEGVPKEYYNIGVRIEDDILVTGTGYKILSGIAPREVGEIEKLMQSGSPKLLDKKD
jgi:Xaa-Pro aminopeptidase